MLTSAPQMPAHGRFMLHMDFAAVISALNVKLVEGTAETDTRQALMAASWGGASMGATIAAPKGPEPQPNTQGDIGRPIPTD